LPEAVGELLGEEKLSGVALFPGKDSLAALERLSELFPAELVVYTESPAGKPLSVPAGAEKCEIRPAMSPGTVLRDYMAGGLNRSNDLNPRSHFLLRGDNLDLDTIYRVGHRLAEDDPETFLSQVGLLQMPSQRHFFVISDGLLNPRPDKNARLRIIRNAAAVWKALSEEPARVALLAAVEQVYPGMQVTVDSAEVATASKDAIRNAVVDGPLSFDVALDAEAARDKGSSGGVAGRANVLIGSTVEVSNGIYVALTMLPKASSASVVVGGGVPLAAPLPSDGADAVFSSLCLAALLGLKQRAAPTAQPHP
jgi:hypothetical protein